MSIAERFLFIGLALLLLEAEATSRLGSSHGVADDSDYQGQSGGGGGGSSGGGGDGDQSVFNVNSYGAQADGETNNQEAFMKTWVDACESSSGAVKVLIPDGTYVSGPVTFKGPCKGSSITFEVQGTIKATTDLSDYSGPDWFLFEYINNFVLTGGGTFDGQGEASWKYNDCKGNSNCQLLASSLTFMHLKDSEIHGINSLNSKSFHMHLTLSESVKVYDLSMVAPEDSPNTDGLHISQSNNIDVYDSKFGTGDDCVSIGEGTTQLTVSGVTCGPGHGISVGSLGRYKNELDVSGITVSKCTLKSTMYGVRIKTWAGSDPSQASDITFEDISMENVKNPIIIDQNYGSGSGEPSQVKISDVHYKNIWGTSATAVAVTLECSSSVPCQDIELADINLKYAGDEGDKSISSSSTNAKLTCEGTQNPQVCDN